MNLAGKNILVVGLGESGAAAARWLHRQGAHVTVTEKRHESDLARSLITEFSDAGIHLEFNGHRLETFLKADLIVISPGVPLDIQPLKEARMKGVPSVGEIELAGRYLKTPAVAVTGTNGKSTVVKLIGEMLHKGGSSVFVGANFGPPLAGYVSGNQTADYAVLELSSFQLDTIETFSPLVALILNVSPDHLDRYEDYDAYARSKQRIFANQGKGQILILNDDDPWLRSLKVKNGPAVFRYGLDRVVGRHAFLDNQTITVRLPGGKEVRFSLERFALPGNHNRSNLMAAILTALLLEMAPPDIQEVIDHVEGLPHRLELVDEIKGVAFYNDSKATNIDAAIKSIASFARPIILIAGGRHKGSDYHPLIEAAMNKVKGAVFLGEARDLLAGASADTMPWKKAEDMDDAVALAYGQAERGDVVLLAPACSSFDMFKDFKHRGAAFRGAVKRLKNGA
jgi:UDP-N-acetylmuramoylalanine--D-glutamate ligase